MIRLWRSTIARIVLLVFGLQIAATGLILFYVRNASQRAFTQQSRALVFELRDDLLSSARGDGMAALPRVIDARLASVRGDNAVVLLTSARGALETGNIDRWPPEVTDFGRWHDVTMTRFGNDRPERMGVVATLLPDGERLITGHVVEDSLQLVEITERAMLGALLLAVPLALIIAAALGQGINARVGDMARTAQAVSGGDLSKRVMRGASGDAFDRLGDALNAMLERIEALVSELRVVTDGLAHDLRSPVTRLTALVDRARAQLHDAATGALFDAIAAEAQALLAMLTTALEITRVEAGIGRDRMIDTDLSAVITDLAEVYGPLAEDTDMAIEADAPASISAPVNRELIGQALANLIDNALKYAIGASLIRLAVATGPEGVELIVADNGAGIPATRIDEARKRFTRLDPSRHDQGAGLGLSLVEAVARMHGGALVLEDNAPGLRATIRLRS